MRQKINPRNRLFKQVHQTDIHLSAKGVEEAPIKDYMNEPEFHLTSHEIFILDEIDNWKKLKPAILKEIPEERYEQIANNLKEEYETVHNKKMKSKISKLLWQQLMHK